MGKKAACALFTALILLICLVPSVGMLLRPGEAGTGGNETLAPLPSLYDRSGLLNTGYLTQLQRYGEDNHYLRQEMITLWSELNAGYLGTSISEDVVLGRDGWLYFGDTLPDYAGTAPMDGRELYATARNLALIREYCEGQGATFLFTVAPNKNSLYPAHMPDLPVTAAPHDAERLAVALAERGIAYLDLFALFRGQGETLYFRTDSHWNSKGAALTADALNDALGRGGAARFSDGPFTPEECHRGDLYDMLYPAGDALEEDQVYGGTLEITYDVPIRSAENLTIMTHGGGEGSLVMFRDSFGNLLYPYMADSTGQALFSRSMPYRLDLVAQREADYVVVELVERNLRYLIQNVPVMPAPRRQAVESARGEGYVSLTWEISEELEGYALAGGTLPPALDDGSPVLVNTADGSCYETFLLENSGFGLYLPQAAEVETVVFYSGGAAVRLPLVL